ncbi:MAG TPA: GspH/FimT family pseudopilin [Gemmatimonadaceae bacterium]|nr:GspH/FimT family pseudopilin [Gemmatimonadaceae bacterium]
MYSRRPGFSAIELMMVVVILGVLSVIAMPKVSELSRSASLHSATRTVATTLTQARAAAIQNGRTTRFIRNGSTILVVLDRPGGVDTVATPSDLYAQHGVALSGANVIQFNPRGFAEGSARNDPIVVANSAKSQSVCIKGLSKIAIQDCA